MFRSHDVWPKFCEHARRTRQGAVLFAVVGGKLSEGGAFEIVLFFISIIEIISILY